MVNIHMCLSHLPRQHGSSARVPASIPKWQLRQGPHPPGLQHQKVKNITESIIKGANHMYRSLHTKLKEQKPICTRTRIHLQQAPFGHTRADVAVPICSHVDTVRDRGSKLLQTEPFLPRSLLALVT
jgi:hypothetical protein